MEGENILVELVVSSAMVVWTVLIHGIGLVILGRLLRLEAQEESKHHIGSISFRGIMTTIGTVLGLFILHGVEVCSYGVLYLELGAINRVSDAMYFSTMTYGTLGYNDSLLAESWRLVAAVEGINGLLLIGWSTAFFVTVTGRLSRL